MEWINVNDKLPEPNVDVLVFLIGWDNMVFQRVLEYCVKDKDFFDWEGNLYNKKMITHWMPLPEPPKKE